VDDDTVGRISGVVDVFIELPDADQDTILRVLMAAGLSPRDAWHCYQYVPMAFAHAAFGPAG
jgi:hypothetical protein